MRHWDLPSGINRWLQWITVATLLLALSAVAVGQSTIASGSIQGTVTDPSGAVVSNAAVTITNSATGQKIARTSNASGAYNSGPLVPGVYAVRVEIKGFQAVQTNVTVQVGSTATANTQLTVGSESQTVEVTGESLAVNTEQATVQGVLTAQQIDNLPVNGRNFLDMAQLEPGVQIQDGGNFDPTKNGMSSVSFGGKAGRTARVTVDGIDISDENVGTTTQNVSAGAISEFQVSQSTLDLSTELTSSGSVNVVTKSGSNAVHGDGFYMFRDKSAGAALLPADCTLNQNTNNFDCANNPYQRNHFGGSLGGPVIKDKLFWFVNAERAKQDQLVPVAGTFNSSGYTAPFRDTTMFGRLDYNGPRGMKLFYKFNYNFDAAVRSDAQSFQPFANKNNTPSHGIGLDFTTGQWAHSIRYGHVYFSNQIADAVNNNPGLFDPFRQWGVAARLGPLGTPDRYGPSRLAPQQTFQRNNQIKYDGSRLWGKHLLRFGGDFNHIAGGGQADFYGIAPELRTSAGGGSDPLAYIVKGFIVSNGIGFATEKPAFGLPGGALTDNRIAFYAGDTWKIRPRFTLNYGLRYSRDTGRAPTDLAPITCNQIDAANFPGGLPCTGTQDLLEQWGSKFAGRVQQPNNSWGPQVGFAYDLTGGGKTVLRGGSGIYYENNVWNNILFDRALRLQSGLFNLVQGASNFCSSSVVSVQVAGVGTVTSFPYNGVNTNIKSAICGQTTGAAAPVLAALQQYIISKQAQAGAQGNGQFVGEALAFTNLVAPQYKTPYSYQMNLGVQHQIRPNMIISADVIRNVSLRYLIQYDQNHVGDARFLNKTAAQNAIAATLAQCNAANLTAALASCPSLHPQGGGVTIDDFASNGLDAAPGTTPVTAIPCDPANGVTSGCGTPATGFAFAGVNPLLGTGNFLVPEGRSTYTALQVKLQHNVTTPFAMFSGMNYQVSYSLSRFNSMIGADQDFAGTSLDSANPGRYYGASSLDRTHQLSLGGSFKLKKGPQFSLIGHVFSPLAVTPTLLNQGRAGEIFHTDVTGDGTSGDVIPGGNIGSYGRDFNGSGINTLINNYNANFAGKLTPAGLALVNAGLFTQADLVALGATTDTVPLAPSDQLGMGWLKTFDLRLQWPIKIGERFTVSPSIAVFNAFNQANVNASSAGPSAALISGVLDNSNTSINGLSRSDAASVTPYRTSVGTGVNTMGAPRQMEFGLRLVF